MCGSASFRGSGFEISKGGQNIFKEGGGGGGGRRYDVILCNVITMHGNAFACNSNYNIIAHLISTKWC